MILTSKFTYVLSLLALVWLAVSCGDKDEPDPAKEALLQKNWVLQYLETTPDNANAQRHDGQGITLTFTNVSTYQKSNEPGVFDLGGRMPLNQYFGRYGVIGSPIVPTEHPLSLLLKVPDLASTQIGGERELMELEQLYLAALKEVTLAHIYPDKLVLMSKFNNTKLVYGPRAEQ